MASYRGHLTFSTALGLAYGGAAFWWGGFSWEAAGLGGLTALSGLLPDLDSDSGVPVRALFGTAGVLVPLLLFRRLLHLGYPLGQVALVMAALYLFIRHGASALFKRLTVHRGMFHSIPGMLITGLIVFLLYHDPNITVRYFLAGGAMVGFVSHLILDELCSVNLVGVKVKLNKFAGSALKLSSPSFVATTATYALLVGLLYLAAPQLQEPALTWRQPTTADTGPQKGPTWVERVTGVHWGN